MTSNVIGATQPSGLRRRTFVPSPAAAAAQRWYIGVTAAAAVVSAAAVSVVASLIF
ncbi:hypothetical protein [Microbacterium enclense]|uniref:Uncharacterized protein n=1 Tax=Microbacterium enclense TaxID=993073 RepID=A0A1G6GLB6_9MICO|nr:hypothetical protein [Microbacterium enclense]SDB82812.1 hypothetical protein SAMN05216418_0401 [Microbacterium enclense]